MSQEKEEVLLEKVREIEKANREKENPADKNNTAFILNEKRELSAPLSDDEARRIMAKHTRRTFLIGGVAALVGIFGWRWMSDEMKNAIYQRNFRWNEKISQTFFDNGDLAPEFPRELAGARVNGFIGLNSELDAANWRLRVGGLANRTDDLILTLDDIKALPRVEMTTELKCIEGWTQIVNWTGARFSDFAAKYQSNFSKYVSLSTPDQEYFVGFDMPSILHPQTLLAYEMNGAPLLPEHGAPLRLATTTKYGIKQIKRIGRIEFTDERPRDFWAESGYDWYSGH